MEDKRELEEKIVDQESYIEAVNATVEDLKMALYTITQLDDIEKIHDLAQEMLDDFYDSIKFLKKTTLQKEKEKFKNAN